MKVLHLNLYRKYFDAILNGEKTIEYRDITPYWSKRLEGRHYDVIQFRNGYAKDAPTMLVEYEGYDVGFNALCEEKYMINLGKVIEVNYGKKNNS